VTGFLEKYLMFTYGGVNMNPINTLENINGFAPFYDTIWPISNDFTFWINVLREWFPDEDSSKIEILELGSGTGRVTVHLARQGYKVTGLEFAEEMRKVCQKKLDKNPHIEDKIRIYDYDFRNFNIPEKFDVAICPFNTFPMILTKDERTKVLCSVHHHLKKDGLLILNIWQKDLSNLQSGWNLWDYETKHEFYPVCKNSLSFYERSSIHAEERLQQIEISIVQTKEDKISNFTGKFYLKLLDKESINRELTEASFKVEEVYGDYERNPCTPTSQLINVVARKI